jgi:cytochrome c biogenesis protein CcdA
MSSVLANVVVVIHILYFLFVLAGIVAIMVGAKWIRNIWMRLLHIAAVYIVVLEDVFQFECPLNTVEWNLRSASESKPVVVAQTTSGITGALNFLLRHTRLTEEAILNAFSRSTGSVITGARFAVDSPGGIADLP